MEKKREYLEQKEEEHRGIKYVLKCVYCPEFDEVSKVISTDIGINGKWWVLENDNTQKGILELAEELSKETEGYIDDFLYEDSLHIWNDWQTLDQREEAMRNVAKNQINELLDCGVEKIDKKIKSLKKLKIKLKEMVKHETN